MADPAYLPSQILRNFQKGNTRDYDVFVSHLTDPYVKEDFLLQSLKGLKECLTELGKDFEVLVGVLLKLDWTSKSTSMVREYQSFVLNLVSANTIYIKASLRMIVKQFYPHGATETDTPDLDVLRQRDDPCFLNVHTLLRAMLKIVPLAPTLLLPLLSDCYPYISKDAYIQECYVKNLLQLTRYLPSARLKILELIIDKMAKLDVRSTREDIQEAEQDNAEDDIDQDIFDMEGVEDTAPTDQTASHPAMQHKDADKLDILMNWIMGDIHKVCHKEGELDWEATKKLYRELLFVFDRIVLPTHACCHVQFTLFYVCSFRELLSEGFLDYLWKKFQDPSAQPVFRQASVAYIASFLARARFVPASTVKACLDLMVGWAHRYICQASETTKPDIQHHGPFYSLCQATFYVFAFRHKELLAMPKGLKFCQGLKLQTIVTCRLNPLRVCLPIVTNTFSSIARQHQLAFCDTILEKNRRCSLPVAPSGGAPMHLTQLNPLDSYFPFDPYLLKRSSQFIHPLYREYEGTPIPADTAAAEDHPQGGEDEEDHYMESGSLPRSIPNGLNPLRLGSHSLGLTPTSPTANDLMLYGTSPGFKHA